MKAKNFIFWLIICFVAIQFLFTVRQGVYIAGNLDLSTAIWFCNLLLQAGCLFIGYFFYRIKTVYDTSGFLNSNSAIILKVISYIAVGLAVTYSIEQSLQRLLESKIVYGHQINLASYAFFVNDFIANFLVKTPFLLLFALSLFLLSDFVKRAIVVKNDNESFI